jgi:XTP/dITP diphosphohydrolase
MKIVIATKNPGKLKEFKELAKISKHLNLDLVEAPSEFGPEETGSTYIENAIIKAKEAARLTGLPAIADDSGIEVRALDGAPGLHSARYCEGTDADRNRKLLKELSSIPMEKRQAEFVAAMAYVSPLGEVLYTTLARWPGRIGFEEKGNEGFGYEPLFLLEGKTITSSELPRSEKHRISHRGLAWQNVADYLTRCIQKDPGHAV